MNVVFMGTPQFAVPLLETLQSEHTITAVYTRPDAASGRGKTLLPSPVRKRAEELGLPVQTPRDFWLRDANGQLVLNTQEQRVVDASLLAALAVAEPDIIVVAAYGIILPAAVLAAAPLGALNLHASLLPRWRGAAPIQRAILAGDSQVGVSVMRMTEGLDTGAYCAVASTQVAEKNAATLSAELAQRGAALLVAQLPLIAAGQANWQEQDAQAVTYADKLRKQEVLPAPELSEKENALRIQAASEQAPARCRIAGREASIIVSSVASALPGSAAGGAMSGEAARDGSAAGSTAAAVQPATPGSVLIHNKKLFLVCADGALEVQQLKPNGKQVMSAEAFINGISANITTGAALRWEAL